MHKWKDIGRVGRERQPSYKGVSNKMQEGGVALASFTSSCPVLCQKIKDKPRNSAAPERTKARLVHRQYLLGRNCHFPRNVSVAFSDLPAHSEWYMQLQS